MNEKWTFEIHHTGQPVAQHVSGKVSAHIDIPVAATEDDSGELIISCETSIAGQATATLPLRVLKELARRHNDWFCKQYGRSEDQAKSMKSRLNGDVQ